VGESGARLTSRYRGPIYRQVARHVPDCLPPREPAPYAGRYHRAGEAWPLYGALDEATIWAEWARATGGGVQPADDPRSLCRFTADLEVLDLREPAVREALGVSVDELIADWSEAEPNEACLRVARRAVDLGADAFIVPSAARPGGWCVDVLPAGFSKLRRSSRRTMIPAPPADVAT
jgi:RES domain-containing protein